MGDRTTGHHARWLADAGMRGTVLGLLAMAMFGLTLPMTRLAVGPQDAPQLSPWFVTFGRAVVAAALSAALLAWTRAPWPSRAQWRPIALAAAGNALGYPLLLGLALRDVSAGHVAVITALLPLATAVFAARASGQRPGAGFWLCAAAGTALVSTYALLRAHLDGRPFGFAAADLLVLAGVLAASMGYVQGALVTPALGAERVICWVTLAALPVTLPGALLTWPAEPASAAAWAGFAYVGLFSMWIGFFAWYRALVIGGAVRVSQLQLVQPFFAIAFSVPLLGERIDATTLGFAAAVIAMVFAGRRLAAKPDPGRSTAASGPGH